MNVELISVGTELLLGDIVNTNVAYLSRELATIGVNVYRHTTVGDNKERLLQALEHAFQMNDTVIITGGLGPTDDDVTKECAAEYFNRPCYLHDATWHNIIQHVTQFRRNNPLTENNKKTAMIPEGATLFANKNGTAPGIMLQEQERRIIMLPGPPREMIPMFQEDVKPYLQSLTNARFVSRYIRFYGIGESLLETKLKHLLETQTNPTIALYAKTGEVLLRVTATSEDEVTGLALVEATLSEIAELVGEYIYLVGDDSIANSQTEMHTVVARQLMTQGLSIAVAESITGGYISSLLIENSGISNSFVEGVVCYANESKINTLGVNPATLSQYGAVSEQTAREMVEGVANRFKTDTAIATTGIAGPNSDDTSKPVGLVYVSTYYKGKITVKECFIKGNRQLIRERAAIEALNELRKQLILER